MARHRAVTRAARRVWVYRRGRPALSTRPALKNLVSAPQKRTRGIPNGGSHGCPPSPLMMAELPYCGHIHQPFLPLWWEVSVRGAVRQRHGRDATTLPDIARGRRTSSVPGAERRYVVAAGEGGYAVLKPCVLRQSGAPARWRGRRRWITVSGAAQIGRMWRSSLSTSAMSPPCRSTANSTI